MAPRLLAVLLLALPATACVGASGPETTSPPLTSLAVIPTTRLPDVISTLPPPPADICASFVEPTAAGAVVSAELRETSGAVASRRNPGVLWAHNDSGDAASVYALGTDGSDLGHFRLTNARALDWEDIALGPGPEADLDYLYLGDIGDNLLIRSRLSVYRIAEPEPGRPGGAVEDVEEFVVTYGELGSFNAEAMAVDPFTHTLVIVTKRDDEGRSVVFTTPLGALEEGTVSLLEPIAVLRLGDRAEVTAADIAGDGGLIALRGYSQVWMWARAVPDLAEVFATEPCLAPSPDEVQGEALALDPSRGGYYTVSEGRGATISYVGSTDS